MFARAVAALTLALVASASHLNARDTCNTGSIQCCDSTSTVQQSSGILSQLGLLNVAAELGGLVGANCSPITVIGAADNSCTGQTVCCKDNSFSGVVALGCSPINV